MKTIKFFTTLVLIFLCCPFVKGQYEQSPKKIKANGDYIHKSTQFNFPEQFDKYARQEVYSFDKKNTNIGVVYSNEQDNQKTTITIYVYPAGDGNEGRLRNEYLNSMQSIANFTKRGLDATQVAVKYKGEKYICNGFKAILKTDINEYNQMSLYECGAWFYKIRISTNNPDTIQIGNIEKTILVYFDPSRLTASKPLNPKASIYFNKAAIKDSVMLGCAMGAAFEKLNWTLKNVDENERASGFPDLYLNMHVEALKAFVKFDKEHNITKTDGTRQYLAELNAIIDAGFLAEFILDQYGMIMIIPANMSNKLDEYNKWKETHPLTIDLKNRYYALAFIQG